MAFSAVKRKLFSRNLQCILYKRSSLPRVGIQHSPTVDVCIFHAVVLVSKHPEARRNVSRKIYEQNPLVDLNRDS